MRRRSENTKSAENGELSKSTQTVAKVGIENKYLSGTYSAQDMATIRSFYNDLKIAYITCVRETSIGSKLYTELSHIFRFTVDLILREGVHLSLLGPSSNTIVSDKSSELDEEYHTEILDGFHHIYSDVVEQYGEAFVVATNSGPVFTSLDGKSSSDSRNTLPGHAPGTHQNLNTTKIMPQAQQLSSYQLSYISPIVSSVPHPSVPPTSLMWGFTHPNSTPMPVPKFLNYKEQKSFTPSIDSNNSMLDSELVESVWYQKYAARRLVTEQAMVDILSGKGANEEDDQKKDIEMEDVKEKTEEEEEKDKNALAEADFDSLKPEDFGEALEWSPNMFIDDDELEAIQNGTELSLISSLILELQEMQKTRLSQSKDSAQTVSAQERRLATKIQNVMSRLIDLEEITPAELEIVPDPKYPVLQAPYTGALPAPAVPGPGSSKRYQSSRSRRR